MARTRRGMINPRPRMAARGVNLPAEKTDTAKPVKTSERKRGPGDRNVGDALRHVYQTAIAEQVPDEMLELLNKLG
jgi:Anti-sigma factor NepR